MPVFLVDVFLAQAFDVDDLIVFDDREGEAGNAELFALVVNGLFDCCKRCAVVLRGRDRRCLLGCN
jgi:hypothetical protein